MLTHHASLLMATVEQFEPRIIGSLGQSDDINLWLVADGQIIADAEFLCRVASSTQTVYAEIGCCSNWLRPHQTRWSDEGGFAWPTGYGGSASSRTGLPGYDWSLRWQWNANENRWEFDDEPCMKRRLHLRIAIPSRSKLHKQAAVHTLWSPGCPTTPRRPLTQFYGLRFRDGTWTATAYRSTNEDAYGHAP